MKVRTIKRIALHGISSTIAGLILTYSWIISVETGLASIPNI